MRSALVRGVLTAALAATVPLASLAVQLPSAAAAGAAAAAASSGSSYHPVTPTRVMDSRTDKGVKGPVAAKGTATLTLPSSVVPASATAVVLDVTATKEAAGGYLTVFPTGTTRPTASSLNFKVNQSMSNLVTVKTGTGANQGKVSFYNGSAGTTELLADVAGYFAVGTSGLSFHPIDVATVMDTAGFFGAAGPVAAQQTVTLTLPNEVIPAGVSAVALNVTVSQPKASGYLTVFQAATTMPTTSNVNFTAGRSVPNMVITKVDAHNKVSFFNGSTGTVQITATAAGYFTTGTTGSAYHSVSPTRVLDSRIPLGIPGPVASHATKTLTLPAAVVPAGATGVVLNVTVTQETAAGYVAVFRGGATLPDTTSVNFVAGTTVANLVIAKLGTGGTVSFYNGSTGSVQVLADVAGYFGP